MGNFNQFLNAILIVVCLLALAFYIAGDNSVSVNTIDEDTLRQQRHAEAENLPFIPAANAREDVPQEVGKHLQALDKAIYDTWIAKSNEMPIYFMVYASWCPHCKRMFQELNQLQAEYDDRIKIVTLSIDNNLDNAEAFIKTVQPLHIETYAVKDAVSYDAIADDFRAHGLHFKGGVGKSVGVPYNAVFYKKQPVAEIMGALPTENLRQTVKDIATHDTTF